MSTATPKDRGPSVTRSRYQNEETPLLPFRSGPFTLSRTYPVDGGPPERVGSNRGISHCRLWRSTVLVNLESENELEGGEGTHGFYTAGVNRD